MIYGYVINDNLSLMVKGRILIGSSIKLLERGAKCKGREKGINNIDIAVKYVKSLC